MSVIPLPSGKPIQRLDSFPVDDSEVFETYTSAVEYVSFHSSAYEGQLVRVKNNAGPPSLYIVTAAKTLYPVSVETEGHTIRGTGLSASPHRKHLEFKGVPVQDQPASEATLVDVSGKMDIPSTSGIPSGSKIIPTVTPSGLNWSAFVNPADSMLAGHSIQNADGSTLTQRSRLKFVGATLRDDSASNSTVVDCSSGLASAMYVQCVFTQTNLVYWGAKFMTVNNSTRIGNVSMASGTRFTAPETGIYRITYSGGDMEKFSEIYTWIRIILNRTTTVGRNMSYESPEIPSVSAELMMTKGHYLEFQLECAADQAWARHFPVLFIRTA